MKMIFKNEVLRGLFFVIIFQFGSCYCHLINTKDGGSYLRDAEFVTAMLRGPAVIATKVTKEGKKAYVFRLIADLTRIINDGLTLYRLVQEKDENWYKWTKIQWMIQDFVDCVSLSRNEIGGKQADSNLLKRGLDTFILPVCEGLTAAILAYYSDPKGRNISLCLQAMVSGSRLLSEMIESKSGSAQQKIVILKTIVHVLWLLVDYFGNRPDSSTSSSASGRRVFDDPAPSNQPQVIDGFEDADTAIQLAIVESIREGSGQEGGLEGQDIRQIQEQIMQRIRQRQVHLEADALQAALNMHFRNDDLRVDNDDLQAVLDQSAAEDEVGIDMYGDSGGENEASRVVAANPEQVFCSGGCLICHDHQFGVGERVVRFICGHASCCQGCLRQFNNLGGRRCLNCRALRDRTAEREVVITQEMLNQSGQNN